MSTGESGAPRRARRWRVPPAPLHGGGQLEGISILRELPGDFGGLLWQTLRSVTLWARVPPARRAGLFNADAGELRQEEVWQVGTPELREPLERLIELLRAPDRADGAEVGRACLAVAAWAERSGTPATRLEFIVAAALAAPADPALALGAARAYRDRGEYVHAEAWYQRAIALARLGGTWEAYARAYVGLGKTRASQGRIPEARRSFEKALRAARRNGIRDVQGMALHDLFALDASQGDYEVALQEAAATIRAYGPAHRLLPALAHDVARFWLERGRPGLALQVLQAVAPKLGQPGRTLAVASLGLAAARTARPGLFGDSLREVEALPDDAPRKGDALVSLARGARELGMHEHAREIARAGRKIALARDEKSVVADMDRLLSEPLEATPAEGIPGRAEAESARLAEELVALLAASAPAGVPA